MRNEIYQSQSISGGAGWPSAGLAGSSDDEANDDDGGGSGDTHTDADADTVALARPVT